jgi:ribosome biogenesis GTPase
MEFLNAFGWKSFPHQLDVPADLEIGRVISIRGFKYILITNNGELETELSGKLLYETENESLPKVGDWVLYKDYETMGYVIELIQRKNLLSRKDPGNKTQRQGLAANIDSALIVQGLDINFNLMRLERYIVQIVSCNIVPVIILNKADLVADTEIYREQVRQLQRDCVVHFCSTLTGMGISEL